MRQREPLCDMSLSLIGISRSLLPLGFSGMHAYDAGKLRHNGWFHWLWDLRAPDLLFRKIFRGAPNLETTHAPHNPVQTVVMPTYCTYERPRSDQLTAMPTPYFLLQRLALVIRHRDEQRADHTILMNRLICIAFPYFSLLCTCLCTGPK